MEESGSTRRRPSLELAGESRLDAAAISTLQLDFDVRAGARRGRAAHAVLLSATRERYGDALAELRGRSDAPLLLLLKRADVFDRIRALEIGADDVLVAPFEPAEILARLRALLRRAGRAAAPEVLRFEDLRIDAGRKTVRRGDRDVAVTETELALLTCLARREGAVVSHASLMREVWGAPISKASVHTFISYLRSKIDGEGEAPLIRTVRGSGYALRFG